jgi:hypothetical protein
VTSACRRASSELAAPAIDAFPRVRRTSEPPGLGHEAVAAAACACSRRSACGSGPVPEALSTAWKVALASASFAWAWTPTTTLARARGAPWRYVGGEQRLAIDMALFLSHGVDWGDEASLLASLCARRGASPLPAAFCASVSVPFAPG